MTMPALFFAPAAAFKHPVVGALIGFTAIALAFTPALIAWLHRTGRIPHALRRELMQRCRSWAVIVIVLVVPILLGSAPLALLGLLLSLLCYREYARATGLFREHALNAVVIVGMVILYAAVIDNYYRLFVATWPFVTALLAATAIIPDRPKGYIQRVALAILGFMLFGVWLAHFSYFGNDPNYRPILLWLLFCVEANDIAGYLCGHLFKSRKLCPNTSPGKTVAGAIGALLIITPLTAGIGHFVFLGQQVDSPWFLLALGALISVTGQLGDLMLSSIKRDVGVKDMGRVLPGHGGLLDRFDSLLMAAPALFHLLNYAQGVAVETPANLLTGAWVIH